MFSEIRINLISMLPLQDAVSTYEQLVQLLESPENQSEATPEMWNNMGTIFSIYGAYALGIPW